MDRKRDNEKRRYITGFDGLRTLAVIAVIVFHALPGTIKGGYLGVPIFLLLSGYLVTSQMVQRIELNEKVEVVSFYIRRIKRLYPTLISMLSLTITYITFFQRELLFQLKSIVVMNILFVYNWWEVSHGQSYFDRFNGESPFTHLWTLGVEVQFYLVWPLILIALFKLIKNRHQIALFVLGMSIVSAVLMAILYDPQNINRVYYGTDTRAFSFLLGAWLAFEWPINKLNNQLKPESKRLIHSIGLISLCIVVGSFFIFSGQSGFVYYGGMYLFSIFAMILMGVIAHPGSSFNRWFTNSLFTWIGKRSYGIYVYQFPVMIFMDKRLELTYFNPFMSALLELIVIVGISNFSYQYIEQPLLKVKFHNLHEMVKKFRDLKKNWRKLIIVCGGLIVLIVAIVGTIQAPSVKPKNALQLRIEKNAASIKKHNDSRNKASKIGSDELAKKYYLTDQEITKAKGMKVTAVGDSVLADSATNLQELMPNIYISAEVGRQAYQTPAVLRNIKNKGDLQHTVILNLGTNGIITDKDVSKILKIIGSKRQIYWITTHIPTQPWQKNVNGKINSVAKKYDNVHVIDWYESSLHHPKWFYEDNVHPNTDGNIQFAKLITKTLVDGQ